MCATRHMLYSGSSTEVNRSFLQYLIHIYEMSGPNSMLRIPNTKQFEFQMTIVSMLRWPIEWDFAQAASWIEKMYKDLEQREMLRYVFRRCPELAEDLFSFIGIGFVKSLTNGLSNVPNTSSRAKTQQPQQLRVEGLPIIY